MWRKMRLPFHSAGMWMCAAPPGDAEVGAVLRDGVVGGVAVLFGGVGALAEFAPVVLLDGGGEGDVDAVVVVEGSPAAGGFVDGEWFGFAAEDAVLPGDVFGEEEVVVLPLGFFVDPETPVVVGDEGAVFGVGDFGAGFARGQGLSCVARVAAVADCRKVRRESRRMMVGQV